MVHVEGKMEKVHGKCRIEKMSRPTFYFERQLTEQGHLVIGVDEVGCGCLAGPVIAAAVHLPLHSRLGEINDSKLLQPHKREELVLRFLELGMSWTVGMATAQEVDALNVRRASKLAMRRAVLAYRGATFVLVDAWQIPDSPMGQRGIIHGDRLVKSIAAASVIAKVVRDRLMLEYDKDFPGYGFSQHKGYGTVQHKAAIQKLGPTVIHRRSFLRIKTRACAQALNNKSS